MSERKPPERHPSTLIPVETVEEIAYRLHLRRLEPPMTPEQSATDVYSFKDNRGRMQVSDDASRRKNSLSYVPLLRDMLRVLVDMGMVTPPQPSKTMTESLALFDEPEEGTL